MTRQLTLTLMYAVATAAWANPMERETNLREGCRKAVAGEYLSAFDHVTSTSGQAQKLEKSRLTLISERAKAEKARDQARLEAQRKDFDLQAAKAQDDAQARLDLFDGQITDLTQAVERANASAKEAEAKKKRLEQRVGEVFRVVKVPATEKGAYPWRLEYKSLCPKYRAICSLPKKEASALKELASALVDSMPCYRYAQQ